MIFQDSFITFSPSDGEITGLDQAPALLFGGDHIAMEVIRDLSGIRGEGLLAEAFCQPQCQGMGGLKPVFFDGTQFQTGAPLNWQLVTLIS